MDLNRPTNDTPERRFCLKAFLNPSGWERRELLKQEMREHYLVCCCAASASMLGPAHEWGQGHHAHCRIMAEEMEARARACEPDDGKFYLWAKTHSLYATAHSGFEGMARVYNRHHKYRRHIKEMRTKAIRTQKEIARLCIGQHRSLAGIRKAQQKRRLLAEMVK